LINSTNAVRCGNAGLIATACKPEWAVAIALGRTVASAVWRTISMIALMYRFYEMLQVYGSTLKALDSKYLPTKPF
jgi:hypothetical protein